LSGLARRTRERYIIVAVEEHVDLYVFFLEEESKVRDKERKADPFPQNTQAADFTTPTTLPPHHTSTTT